MNVIRDSYRKSARKAGALGLFLATFVALLIFPGIDLLSYHLLHPTNFWQVFLVFAGFAFTMWPFIIVAGIAFVFVATVLGN